MLHGLPSLLTGFRAGLARHRKQVATETIATRAAGGQHPRSALLEQEAVHKRHLQMTEFCFFAVLLRPVLEDLEEALPVGQAIGHIRKRQKLFAEQCSAAADMRAGADDHPWHLLCHAAAGLVDVVHANGAPRRQANLMLYAMCMLDQVTWHEVNQGSWWR